MKTRVLGLDTFDEYNYPLLSDRRHLFSRELQWQAYTFCLTINDLALMLAAFALAFNVRFNGSFPLFENQVIPSEPFYLQVSFLLAPFWWLIFKFLGLYDRELLLGGTEEYERVVRATLVGLLFVIVVSFLVPAFIIARGWILMSWFFSVVFIIIGRFFLRRIIYFLRNFGYFTSPAIIVGANEEGIHLANQLSNWQTSGLNIIGFVDKKLAADTFPCCEARVLGDVSQLGSIISRYRVEELILSSSAFSTRDNLVEIFKEYGTTDGVNVRMSSGLYEIITTGLTVREFASVPLVEVNRVRLTGVDQLLKSVLDYILTVPLVILISPILLLIALLVKLDSPGPVIYRRRVMGVNGKKFDAYKFRTMYINGDEILSRQADLQNELVEKRKLKNDPRITRVGRILRKYSLDELPQLINVLKFEMSLVGPRMISPEEMENYNHWGINLLTVRPGITGLWQVSGRSDITYNERVRLDMHYIRNWSIWFDLQLLFQTFPAVLKGKGAY